MFMYNRIGTLIQFIQSVYYDLYVRLHVYDQYINYIIYYIRMHNAHINLNRVIE